MPEEEGIKEKSGVAVEEPTGVDDEDDDDIAKDIDNNAKREKSKLIDLDAVRKELSCPCRQKVMPSRMELRLSLSHYCHHFVFVIRIMYY